MKGSILRLSPLSRRAVLGSLAAIAVAPNWTFAAEPSPAIKVYKDPNCGCCGQWAKHIVAAGIAVSLEDVADLDKVKIRLGVPDVLQSCHTGEIAGYVIEGHVPAAAIKRLLAERPQARGLAVPGMPVGSPGMEGSPADAYEVILFGPGGNKVFARYRGAREI